MLMPTLSVTGIGIAIAVLAIIRGKPATRALLGGLLGAWLGFIAAAIPGAILDVILGSGVYLALFGHIGAAAGAIAAITWATAAARRRPG